MNSRAVVAKVLELWSTQDIESTFAYVAEDVVYALHFDEELAPFAGVTYGRDAMMGAFYKMIEEFDYLEYKPVIMSAENDKVRVYTRHRYHHRRTGSEISGSYRTVFTLNDGLIVRCEEYVDRGMVEAFMRLAQHREATNQIVLPPEIPPRRIATEDARWSGQLTADASGESPPEEGTTEGGDKERCNS